MGKPAVTAQFLLLTPVIIENLLSVMKFVKRPNDGRVCDRK